MQQKTIFESNQDNCFIQRFIFIGTSIEFIHQKNQKIYKFAYAQHFQCRDND